MKLIIDIDDKTYDRIKRIDKIHGIAPLNEYEIAIANGTPLSEELEKMKAEIKTLSTCELGSWQEIGVGEMKSDVINVINEHISKLKGENK